MNASVKISAQNLYGTVSKSNPLVRRSDERGLVLYTAMSLCVVVDSGDQITALTAVATLVN